MENIKLDSKALTEVYEVLLMLDKDKFDKIPKNIIEGIKNNRDIEYEVDINDIEENMLSDTQKILATIYTYYLATPEEKSTIFQMIELEKKQQYGKTPTFNQNQLMFQPTQNNQIEKELETHSVKEQLALTPVSDNIISRIKKWLKKQFRIGG